MTNAPIFVIGSYRSGTSIFAWCLGQHPNIVNLPETNWLARLALNVDELYQLGTVNARHSHLGQVGLEADQFARQVGDHVNALVSEMNPVLIRKTEAHKKARAGKRELRRQRSESDPKTRWVDATPENSHYVYSLHRMFPEAKFIHLLRNPVDVARSLSRFSTVGPKDYGSDEAFATWIRLVSASVEAERALGSGVVYRIRYEDLIEAPRVTLDQSLEFLGEASCAECVNPLNAKINSSKVDNDNAAVDLKGKSARIAIEMYEDLTGSGQHQGAPDESVLKALQARHAEQVRNLRDPVRLAARNTKSWVGKLKSVARRILPPRK